MPSRSLLALALAFHSRAALGRVWNYETDFGAVADDPTDATTLKNGQAMNVSLGHLRPGDELLVPNKTFHIMGGIVAANLTSVVLRIDGTLAYAKTVHAWPRRAGGDVFDCMTLRGSSNLTITSSGVGTLDGNGAVWWGLPGIGYLVRQENRPKLLTLDGSSRVLVERVRLINSPYWTFWAPDSDGLEVRHVTIDARRTRADEHTVIDLTAFNTDGFDVTGRNVWIHDCQVWNQDDTVCVKGNSENMVFERINASGVGLTIGSIGPETVRNITFREIRMHHTYKGIYLKFNGGANDKPGLISDVLYEDITMEQPEQWPIWIGPAQQADSVDLCRANPCSLCWPQDPFAKCESPANGTFANITLRRVTVLDPKTSPGVLLAPAGNHAKNITFDGVRVINGTTGRGVHGGAYFKCENFEGVATGGTTPVPPCFKSQ
jgi:hypothetical protein